MHLQSRIRLASGNEMPVIGLGTRQLTDDTQSVVAHALGAGYPMLDVAAEYGNLPGIGAAIKKAVSERARLFVTMRVAAASGAAEAVGEMVETLGIGHADLVLLPPPLAGSGDDAWRALAAARTAGLLRDIGVTNYSAEMIDDLVAETGEAPVVNQVEWSPFGHSNTLLDHARARGIVLQAHSPLTRGALLEEPVLHRIAAKYGKTPAQAMLRWNLQRGIVPLPRANKHRHQRENLAIFDFRLSDADMADLIRLNRRASATGRLAYA